MIKKLNTDKVHDKYNNWVIDDRYKFAMNLGTLSSTLNYHKSLVPSNSLSNPQGLVSTQGINDGCRVFPFLVEEWPQVTCVNFEYDYPISLINKNVGQNTYSLRLWGDWNYLKGIEINGMLYPDIFDVSNTSPSTFSVPIPDDLKHIIATFSWTRYVTATPYSYTYFDFKLDADWANQYVTRRK